MRAVERSISSLDECDVVVLLCGERYPASRLAQHSGSRALRLPAGEVKDPDTDAVGRFQCP
jgi:hypothetical protein